MLLRTSISNTKKFFKKTLQSFKSLVSGGGHYQKLPKSPPSNPFSCTHETDMNFNQNYEDINNQFYANKCDGNEDNAKKTSKKKIISSSPLKNETAGAYSGRLMKSMKSSSSKSCHEVERGEKDRERKSNINVGEGKGRKQELKYSCCKGHQVKEKEGIRSCLVLEKKLKELEMMDKSNVEHVLDIEEVLHYYSRLTCPAYLDIIDKFFMEIYAEFGSVE